ncbi:MAG: DNA cytosine methyltransferase [Xanthomonadales bacterium]|nr:DNA cytosine methyltransferase [Xanthomonadales bacterium]
MSTQKRSRDTIGIIDIFAGPGGLGEGFNSFEPKTGHHPFRIGVSAEMERSAHATLRLRAFYRLLREREGTMPRPYLEYLRALSAGTSRPPEFHFSHGPLSSLWEEAEREALNLTLGEPAHNKALYERITEVRKQFDQLVLIGGPPCQAYSLVGRARQRNVEGFATRGDHRHFLYREYLEILAQFKPDVFIMENVKGILSSTVGGRNMFANILRDLADPSRALGKRIDTHDQYVILPIHSGPDGTRCSEQAASDPAQFVIRSEAHGVPQARHRVILMGVRREYVDRAIAAEGLLHAYGPVTVKDALRGLPPLRSGLSRQPDDAIAWAAAIQRQKLRVLSSISPSAKSLRERIEGIEAEHTLPRASTSYASGNKNGKADEQQPLLNHETRGHMEADLGRYLFCASYALDNNRSPSSAEFPRMLAPDHANWNSGDFADRFRVQLKNKPSSTVTSHLSKDGHAFIHWDPSQCRSLTVREAARLQTFPDNYLFLGNRTQQFVQVGNAVPPAIACQIARVVWSILQK